MASPTIAITVRLTNTRGLTFAKDFTVTATDANEAPTDVAMNGTSIAASRNTQGAAALQIQGNQLQASPSSLPRDVTTTDAGGLTFTCAVGITVTGLADAVTALAIFATALAVVAGIIVAVYARTSAWLWLTLVRRGSAT